MQPAEAPNPGWIVAATKPRLAPIERRVFLLCSLVAFFDGFDTQSIGPAAAAIGTAVGVSVGELGPIFSASQLGFLLGAMSFGALGDRFGRKRLLVGAVAIFALCSLGTALVHSFDMLVACRLFCGLGLGGATPNFVGLVSEYTPPRLRARVVTTMWAAVPFGGMVGSFASSAVLPWLGWQAMFHIGFAAPMALALLLVAMLPESREAPRVATAEPRLTPLTALFAHGRAIGTLWLWLASFAVWMVLIVVAFWTPALLQRDGLSAASAATVLAFNNAGGVVGTLLVGAALSRIRPVVALLGACIASGVAIAAIGVSAGHYTGLLFAASLAGFFASAAGGTMIAVAAEAYPTEARATGIGWALGFGRLGSIAGPLAAGLLVAHGLPIAQFYLAAAIPAFVAAGFVFLLSRRLRSGEAGA